MTSFNDMSYEEQYEHITRKYRQFQTTSLPGQPLAAHMGTVYMVNEMVIYIERLRAEIEELNRK